MRANGIEEEYITGAASLEEGFLRFSQATNFDAIYGGGESNVAVSLANYGIDVDFVTRLSKNDIGIFGGYLSGYLYKFVRYFKKLFHVFRTIFLA